MSDLILPSGIPCSLCWNGEVITLPDKEIAIQGFEFVNNCQALADFVPLLFQQESNECAMLQSIGTLCGCPREEDSCNLCSDGTKVVYGWRELEFLADSFGGIVPTCEIVEAGLHSYSQTDSYCGGSQLMLSEHCGCGAEQGSQPPELEESERCQLCPGQEAVPFPNKTIDIAGFPFQTCGQLEKAAIIFEDKYETVGDGINGYLNNNCVLVRQLSVHCGCRVSYAKPCPICKLTNSYEVPHPEKMLDTSLTQLFLPGVQLSCGILADVAMMWSSTDPDHLAVCSILQGIGTECGCPAPKEPACEICADPLQEEYSPMSISNVPPYDIVTCAMTSIGFLFMEDGSPLPLGVGGGWVDFECRIFQYSGFICGCNDGLFDYWGAETVQKQRAAVWVQRVTAILSLIGSIAIIVDIFVTKQRQSRGMYYQIMLGLSVADVLSSIAWGLGPIPANPNVAALFGFDSSLLKEGDFATFYGAYGNDASCKAQGFLLHLGFTSILYNASLSYFFKLSVVDGWRDSHFTKRYRIAMLGFPAIIGMGVACGAVPFIISTPIACTIGSSKDPGGWAKLIGLFYLPYGPAFIFAPLNTCFIYWKVRQQSQKGNRWRLTGVRQSSMMSGLQQSSRGFRDEGSERNTTGNEEKPSRMKQVAMTIGRAVSFRGQSESQMERLVFWQSFWYVISFFASYSIFLVAFAFDGWSAESYWFYILLSILTPMQGFFNGCVYFRKRLVKLGGCGKKRTDGAPSTLSVLGSRLLWPITASIRWLRGNKYCSLACHGSKNDVVSGSPDVFQPIELLNARRANTTQEEKEEEKVEELPLEGADSSPSLPSELPPIMSSDARCGTLTEVCMDETKHVDDTIVEEQ